MDLSTSSRPKYEPINCQPIVSMEAFRATGSSGSRYLSPQLSPTRLFYLNPVVSLSSPEVRHQHQLPQWKKLLYLKQPYPDNYTDKSFLSQLKRNTTVKRYSYVKLVEDFSLIVFHVSCILLVILTFKGIYVHNWDPVKPTILSSVIWLLGFASLPISNDNKINTKSFILIIFILLILSPVLKSLTKSTSSDSIWAISFMLCIANVLLHDYTMNSANASRRNTPHRPIISTNISLSNAIVLASRLGTTVQVFLFILFAIQTSIILPLFDAKLRQLNYKWFHLLIFAIVFNHVNYMMYSLLNYKFLVYWLIAAVTMIMIIPAYFLSLQRYKNELQGPWDTAKPVLKTNLSR